MVGANSVSCREINSALNFVPQTAEIIHNGRTGAAANGIGSTEQSAAPPAQTWFSVNLGLTLDI